MGVTDYVHARDGDPRPFGSSDNENRIFGHPSRFVNPFTAHLPQQQGDAGDQERHRSVFDTDVEGIDDSTITVTSAAETEDQQRELASGFARQRFSHNWQESPTSDYSEDDNRRVGYSPRPERHRLQSPYVPANGNYGGGQTRINWRMPARAYQPLEYGGNDQREERPPSRHSPENSMSHDMPRTAPGSYRRGHKASQSLATTPQNRFNFRNERPYERLIQQSPTHGAKTSGSQRTPQNSGTTPLDKERLRRKYSSPPRYMNRSVDNRKSLDSTDDDSFSGTTTTTDALGPEPSEADTAEQPARRSVETDYPPEILARIPYSELDNEPFDLDPASPSLSSPPISGTSAASISQHPSPTRPLRTRIPVRRSSPRTSPATKTQQTATPKQQSQQGSRQLSQAESRISFLLQSSESDQRAYLSSLPLQEWESVGDEIIAELGTMLTKIKEARQARRRTAAVFEAEIRRRHEESEEQKRDIEQKMWELREGGMGVLRKSGRESFSA